MLSLHLEEPQLLDPQFDSVRNYVRRPARDEIWPYSVAILGADYMPGVDLLLLAGENWPVLLRFFNHAFVVALLPTADIHQYVLATLADGVSWHKITGRRPRPNT
jgi:hypothetical protein